MPGQEKSRRSLDSPSWKLSRPILITLDQWTRKDASEVDKAGQHDFGGFPMGPILPGGPGYPTFMGRGSILCAALSSFARPLVEIPARPAGGPPGRSRSRNVLKR